MTRRITSAVHCRAGRQGGRTGRQRRSRQLDGHARGAVGGERRRGAGHAGGCIRISIGAPPRKDAHAEGGGRFRDDAWPPDPPSRARWGAPRPRAVVRRGGGGVLVPTNREAPHMVRGERGGGGVRRQHTPTDGKCRGGGAIRRRYTPTGGCEHRGGGSSDGRRPPADENRAVCAPSPPSAVRMGGRAPERTGLAGERAAARAYPTWAWVVPPPQQRRIPRPRGRPLHTPACDGVRVGAGGKGSTTTSHPRPAQRPARLHPPRPKKV